LFNHEGPRRGEDFVTRKISKGVARIFNILNDTKSDAPYYFEPIELGNLDAKRDWSDADDMVDGVWRMLNQDQYKTVKPKTQDWLKDYVCASDENHTIRDFIVAAFDAAGIRGKWFINSKNDPLTEKYTRVDKDGILMPDDVLVKVNPKFYRPAEVEVLRGNSSAIRKELGWAPKTSFKQLVEKMVRSDLNKTQ
jgi:GDPmannose 4,6-dehydratase